VIASGRNPMALRSIVAGKEGGTRFTLK
jgi:hypothetical protein